MRATSTFIILLLSFQFSIYSQITTGVSPVLSTNQSLLNKSAFIERLNFDQVNANQIFPLNFIVQPGEIVTHGILNAGTKFKNNGKDIFSLYSVTPGARGFGNLLMADCNRDGVNELIYARTGMVIFVEISKMDYRIVHTLYGDYNPIAIGYIDDDNKIDLVVQEGNMVKVFEGSSMFAFPTQLVWAHTLDGPYGQGNVQQNGSITDINRDGRKEITMTSNQLSNLDYGAISVFECHSNNNYERIIYLNLNYDGSGLGSLAIGDINNDSTIEIAVAAGIGDTLYVFECNRENSLIIRYKVSTGLINQYSVILTKDLDGDRIPEVCVSGDGYNPSGMRIIQVYEFIDNDQRSSHALINQFTGLNGIQPIATGNILSQGRDELVLQSSGRTYVFNAIQNNKYSLTATLEEDGGSFVYYFNLVNELDNDELVVLWPGNVYTFTSSDNLNNFDQVATSVANLSNYPNPFNPSTTIKYCVQEKGNIKLSVYNIAGEKVSVLVNEIEEPGFYEVIFNALNLPSGIYFYSLQAGEFISTKKMILLK